MGVDDGVAHGGGNDVGDDEVCEEGHEVTEVSSHAVIREVMDGYESDDYENGIGPKLEIHNFINKKIFCLNIIFFL